jgi:hypothetical protein
VQASRLLVVIKEQEWYQLDSLVELRPRFHSLFVALVARSVNEQLTA